MAIRYRYNPDVQSLPAMAPAMIPLLLMILAMLTALGVVREKELGSIANFYVTPTTRLEVSRGSAHSRAPVSVSCRLRACWRAGR